MYLDRYLRLIAGTIVLLSAVLAAFVSPWWLLMTAFVGVNLFIGGATGWCPAIGVMRKMGVAELPPVKNASCC